MLRRVVDVKSAEVHALLLSGAYFFCILCAYYILRPIREEAGVAGGVRNIKFLYTGTLLVMLAANPVFAALVARWPRRRFVSLTYQFFVLNLLTFFFLMKLADGDSLIWVGRIFFVWLSVFNMFVVSIFWAFMADLYTIGQGKRLFGFIGVGGTLGGIAGAGLTALLAERVGPVHLVLVSVLLLECAVLCVWRLSAHSGRMSAGSNEDAGRSDAGEKPVGGSILAGITHVLKSPYLLGICLYILLYTITATILYFQQAELAARQFDDRAARTAFFAWIDFGVNVLTVVTQAFLTGRIIKQVGIGVTLALLPALCVIGFTGLGLWPTITVLVVFQVLRRAGAYSVSRPARETLFTVVPREDKYKAKSLIDTFVYRGGDQIGAWSNEVLVWLGLGMASIAFVTAPVAGLWMMVGLWLGRRQATLARAGERPGA